MLVNSTTDTPKKI